MKYIVNEKCNNVVETKYALAVVASNTQKQHQYSKVHELWAQNFPHPQSSALYKTNKMSLCVSLCLQTPWSSPLSSNSLTVSLFVLNDRQELYHGKPQWHSKASIFTTCKHQWPNLKDWLIPLLTWLAASGCVYKRQPSLFNSARCQGERVMSFKLHCYASLCLCPATFQVQAYFEEEAQSCKPS